MARCCAAPIRTQFSHAQRRLRATSTRSKNDSAAQSGHFPHGGSPQSHFPQSGHLSGIPGPSKTSYIIRLYYIILYYTILYQIVLDHVHLPVILKSQLLALLCPQSSRQSWVRLPPSSHSMTHCLQHVLCVICLYGYTVYILCIIIGIICNLSLSLYIYIYIYIYIYTHIHTYSAMSCYAMRCYAMVCDAMRFYARLG